jgi:hypothetical protein
MVGQSVGGTPARSRFNRAPVHELERGVGENYIGLGPQKVYAFEIIGIPQRR